MDNLFLTLQLRQLRRTQGNRERNHFQKSYSWVQRFQLTTLLSGHRGCVNTIRWSSDGQVLASGSDDMMVHLWQLGPHLSGRVRPRNCFPTLHRHNIFDAHILNDIHSIVSCGADGYVCLTNMHSGHKVKLFEPDRGHFFAFKIALLPDTGGRTFFVSCGDGHVRHFDLRQTSHSIAISTNGLGLAGLSTNPVKSEMLAVGGNDPFLRMYDARALCLHAESQAGSLALTPVISLHSTEGMICRQHSFRHRSDVGISGVCWSANGQSILANYRGSEIEWFTVGGARLDESEIPEQAIQLPIEVCKEMSLPLSSVRLSSQRSFLGRLNEQTCAKEVCFLCGESAVGSGGDCGHFFIWDALSGELRRKFRADRCIVNCMAPHPVLPVVATSGIDSDIKVFDVGDRRPAMQTSKAGMASASSEQDAPERGPVTCPQRLRAVQQPMLSVLLNAQQDDETMHSNAMHASSEL